MVITDAPGLVVSRPRPRSAQTSGSASGAVCAMSAVPSAVPALRRFARAAARRWAVPAEGIDTLALVVSELATNVVLHSGSPEITLLLRHSGAELTVEVADAGRWQDRSMPRLSAEDADAPCGRGLDLVTSLAGRWLASLSPIGTRVVVSLPLTEATE
ncbi:ATP-binding protein [Streptacidiphilus pinicola]|uniref:ATP-binding protein n=1 Tax=Streptacidiphilus pinicola TaxID=2219663 RepID=A0A2X0KFS6_9ACTN|nr:ATP-binding protein [Streptacidiphilus pinicola]RAG85949.1 ATP-binding protein [Streptacidiphilus pinicola]